MGGLSEGLVYVDEHIVVLDKPAGLLAVPGRGADKQDCLSARAQRLWPDARVVHRLDMATSGLFLMARGADLQRRLSISFQEREVDKRYQAVVAGDLSGEGEIDLPIGADWHERPRRRIDRERGRASLTRWRSLPPDPARAWDGDGASTRVELQPVTGRTHQLRLHLAAIGHPILGDALYAPPRIEELAPRLLLHASRLELVHPILLERMAFDSSVPF